MNRSNLQSVINTLKAVFDNGGVIGFKNADMLVGCVIVLENMMKEGDGDVLDSSGNPDA